MPYNSGLSIAGWGPMTPRERVVAALEILEPDRVPLFEMHVPTIMAREILKQKRALMGGSDVCYRLISQGADVNEINRTIADEHIRCARALDLDFIRVPAAFLPGSQVRESGGDWLIDGSRYRYISDSMWRLDEPSTYDPDEVLAEARNYKPPDIPEETFSVLETIRDIAGEEYFLSFDADGSWGPIVSSPNLLKHILLWMRTRPEVVDAVLDKHTTYAIRLGEDAIEAGADAILMCVDYGLKDGPWMSPEMFRRFIKPALARQASAFSAKGAYPILHSDGNIMSLLPDIVDSGVRAYQGIDVMAGMDLGKVKQSFGDRLCLIGNVDPRVIEFGTWADVEKEVRRCLKDAAAGGGFVLSASANVSANSNTSNFVHMLEYAKETGRYPVTLG
jgi:hypothetical protein